MSTPGRSALAAAVLLLAACASPGAPPAEVPQLPPGLFEDAAFAAPREAPDAQAVFALSPAMRRYVDVELSAAIQRNGRQRALVEALYRQAQLRLEYDAERTRTAAQAFDVRAGNCLSLVVMTAALAQHLELPVAFQVVEGHESWSRSGDLSVVNGHVNITVGQRLVDRIGSVDADPQVRLDFGALPAGRGQALRTVQPATILAMFMNNRAAEHLVRGALDDAYAHAREALRQDAGYAGAYNTLGVIYARRGLRAAAERAYRASLERDAAHKPALQNVARLLQEQGRTSEAEPFTQRLAQLEREPPFEHFDRGVAAAKAGDYAAARDHLLREMRRDGDYHEFHFWLAVALNGLGEREQARRHLDLAARNSTTQREQALYAAKLRSLGGTASGEGSTRSQ